VNILSGGFDGDVASLVAIGGVAGDLFSNDSTVRISVIPFPAGLRPRWSSGWMTEIRTVSQSFEIGSPATPLDRDEEQRPPSITGGRMFTQLIVSRSLVPDPACQENRPER